MTGSGVSGSAPSPGQCWPRRPEPRKLPARQAPPGPQPSQQRFPSLSPHPQPQVLRGQEARKRPSYRVRHICLMESDFTFYKSGLQLATNPAGLPSPDLQGISLREGRCNRDAPFSPL